MPTRSYHGTPTVSYPRDTRVRCRDPKAYFSDPETGLEIGLGESKLLPCILSDHLAEWLRGGGLVVVSPEVDKAVALSKRDLLTKVKDFIETSCEQEEQFSVKLSTLHAALLTQHGQDFVELNPLWRMLVEDLHFTHRKISKVGCIFGLRLKRGVRIKAK